MHSYLISILVLLGLMEACFCAPSGKFVQINNEPMVSYSGIARDIYGLGTDGSINWYQRYTSSWYVVSGSSKQIGAAGTNLYAIGNPDNNHVWEYNTINQNWTGVVYTANYDYNVTLLIEGGNQIILRDTEGSYYQYQGNYSWSLLPGAPFAIKMCSAGGQVVACVGTNLRLYIYALWPSCNCYRFSDTDFDNGFMWTYVVVGYGGSTVYAVNSSALPYNNLQQLNYTSGHWQNLLSPAGSNNIVYSSTQNGLYGTWINGTGVPAQGIAKWDGNYWYPISTTQGSPAIYGPATAQSPVSIISGQVGLILSS